MAYCKNCLWGDICTDGFKCDHYTALDESYLDVAYDRNIFNEEWKRYVKEPEIRGGFEIDYKRAFH